MQYRLKGIKEDINLLCESLVEIRGSLRYLKSCPNVINTRTASILLPTLAKHKNRPSAANTRAESNAFE